MFLVPLNIPTVDFSPSKNFHRPLVPKFFFSMELVPTVYMFYSKTLN